MHEAMYVPGIDRMLARRAYVPPKLRNFLMEGHTSAEDCGRIAAQAGVGTLVLTHLLPGNDPEMTDQRWHEEASALQWHGPDRARFIASINRPRKIARRIVLLP